MKKNAPKRTAAAIVCTAMTAALAVHAAAAASAADVRALCSFLTKNIALSSDTKADLNNDGVINAVDLTLMKREALAEATQPETPADTALYVTQITFADSGVTLKNASDAVVDAAKAENVKVENGTYVTITKQTSDGTTDYGDINIDGECKEGQIKVDVDENAYPNSQVTLNLRGLTLSNSKDSPIYIQELGDECVITSKKDTVNTISDGTDYKNADESAAAIYSLDDLKFKGKGTLIVNGNCKDGIVSKDDMKIWNGDIQVTAADDGIRGKDSIRIGDPDAEDYSSLKLTVYSKGGDGIRSTNDTADSGKGYIKINGGTIDVKADYGDGIQAEQEVMIAGGDINIYTYQGSGYTGSGTATGGQTNPWQGGGFGPGGMQDGNSNKTDISAKAIKTVGIWDEAGTTYQSAGNITFTGGNITIDCSDDAIHCAGDMFVTGGVFNIATSDDAFHSDHNLSIGTKGSGSYDDVQIYISKCYEGIEAVYINQNSGTVYIVSGDDGYNAAGGADNSGSGNTGMFGPGQMGGTFGELNLNGGFVVVNSASGDHDAFDSNGNINITGGYYVCNGQEPLDCGDGGYSISQTGGTYIRMTAGNTNLTQTYTFKDASGNAVVTFQSASGSPGISSKDNSTCYSGTTVSGGTKLLGECPYGVTLGGTVSGGTQVTGSGSSSTQPGGPGQRP